MLTPHFTLEEMIVSQTASREGINNSPTDEALINLRRVCEMLEAVRHILGGKPVLISSGYRCPELNAACGGSSNSEHMTGCAADFTCPGFGSPHDVCKKIMSDPRIKYNQLIWEYGDWIHMSVPAIGVQAKMEELTINNSGTFNGIA
jgi:hypothetical protein